MKKETRIIKRTAVDNSTSYVIQQRHFLFFWRWTDARQNGFFLLMDCRNDSFDTLDQAKMNLCFFDGSKITEEVVYSSTYMQKP